MSIIDDYIEKKQANRKVREPNILYVTDITKPCMRNSYYSITLDKPTKPETLRIFQIGTLLEDYYLTALQASENINVLGTQIAARHRDQDGFEIHGRCDAIAQHGDATLVIHEVKSAKSSSWRDEAQPEHVDQLQFYLNILGIDTGLIDYVDKTIMLQGNDPRHPNEKNPPDRSFPITRDQEAYKTLLEKARKLHAYLKKREPPPPTECWQCNGYCDYAEECAHTK